MVSLMRFVYYSVSARLASTRSVFGLTSATVGSGEITPSAYAEAKIFFNVPISIVS